jgi:hypothetical protein
LRPSPKPLTQPASTHSSGSTRVVSSPAVRARCRTGLGCCEPAALSARWSADTRFGCRRLLRPAGEDGCRTAAASSRMEPLTLLVRCNLTSSWPAMWVSHAVSSSWRRPYWRSSSSASRAYHPRRP